MAQNISVGRTALMAENLICWDIATGIWDAMFSPASAGAAVWLACQSQREKLFKTLPFCRMDFFRRQTQTELLGHVDKGSIRSA
ncbi:hypothetical protein FXF46_13060 [Gluconobacter thailandicus]|uniref:Uncharacterized protein n=1 Tax=Gluconobacter thailandicus TaxID=257438 RepID=A0AAP9ESP6_GLUTH|nr:hypothetical protein FXF46_13060 [Gluconobacter thailandicus]